MYVTWSLKVCFCLLLFIIQIVTSTPTSTGLIHVQNRTEVRSCETSRIQDGAVTSSAAQIHVEQIQSTQSVASNTLDPGMCEQVSHRWLASRILILILTGVFTLAIERVKYTVKLS